MDLNKEKKSTAPYSLNVKLLRQMLIIADDIIHFLVAVTLLCCAGLITFQTLPKLLHPDALSIIHVLNDLLLALIIMELMWPIVRFLNRKPFSLNPFLYIGIISSIRRILFIEAEHSMLSRSGPAATVWASSWPVLVEQGANVAIILLLALALRLLATNTPET